MKIYLIRHGQTDWNLLGKLQGSTDIPLNETGVRQAVSMAAYMKDTTLESVYSSPYKRAKATAEILCSSQGLEGKEADSLREICMGKWEGLTWEEIESQYPDALMAFQLNPMEHSSPKGERYQDVIDRVGPWVDGILYEAKGNIALVSHGITIGCILKYLFWEHPEVDISARVGNASVTTLEYNQKTKELRLIQLNSNGFIC